MAFHLSQFPLRDIVLGNKLMRDIEEAANARVRPG